MRNHSISRLYTQIPMGANVLSMLTRLRQLALHPSLIPENYLEVSLPMLTYTLRFSRDNPFASVQELRRAGDLIQHAGAPAPVIDPETLTRLQKKLWDAIKDGEECSICFDMLDSPRITPCSHYFCLDCIKEVCPCVTKSSMVTDCLCVCC